MQDHGRCMAKSSGVVKLVKQETTVKIQTENRILLDKEIKGKC